MIYPGAIWRGPIPLTNYRPGAMGGVDGIVVHHMVATLDVCDRMFRTFGLGRSADFGTGRDGTVYQWVDTDDVAYHACNANWTHKVGIENDDQAQDLPLSDEQIQAIRGIIAWLGVPSVPMVGEHDAGVGYHGQFPGDCSVHWGQTACPGVMVDQIPEICFGAPSLPTGDNMIYKADRDSTSNPGVKAGTHWQIVGQFDGGTYLNAVADPAAFPHSDVMTVDGELLGKISKWNGGVGSGASSAPPAYAGTVTLKPVAG